VAEVLKKAGYATGLFGKWGLGDIGTEGVPERQGFDEYTGYLSQVHAHLYYPKFIYRNGRELPLEGNGDGKRVTYSHDVIARHALEFIRRHKDQPFFCYVPFTIPHWELLVPEDSIAEYRGTFPEPPIMRERRGHYAAQSEPHAAYAGMVTRMDRDVGRIMALLRELAIDDSTIVFFTSDNGTAMPILKDDFFEGPSQFRGHKQNLYEGGIRVPMIARWPGKIAARSVNRHPWYFCDFMPTAAELAGGKPPSGVDGISVVPTLRGDRNQPVHEFMYWELPRYDAKTGTFSKEIPMQAVRFGGWKAVRPKPDGALELYNLAEDISESRNVAASHPGVLKRIEEYLATARTEPRPQTQPATPWWDVVD
jgi:arylsulfatase A-like enzyme